LSSFLFVDNAILLLLSKFIIIRRKLEWQHYKILVNPIPTMTRKIKIDYYPEHIFVCIPFFRKGGGI